MPLHAIDNEADLLLQVADGDQKAFAELFYAYHNQLAEFVLMLTGCKQQTQEIVQDVFMKVWNQRSSLPALQHFVSWLFVLTRNYTLNSLRKAATEKKVFSLSPSQLYHPVNADDRIIEKDYREVFDRAVAQLPPQQQKAYKMSRVEGLGNEYIGKVLGVAPESVRKYLQWAQQSVARFVKSQIGPMLLFLLLDKM